MRDLFLKSCNTTFAGNQANKTPITWGGIQASKIRFLGTVDPGDQGERPRGMDEGISFLILLLKPFPGTWGTLL